MGKALEKRLDKICGPRIFGLSSHEVPVAFLDFRKNRHQLWEVIKIARALSGGDASPGVSCGQFGFANASEKGCKSATGICFDPIQSGAVRDFCGCCQPSHGVNLLALGGRKLSEHREYSRLTNFEILQARFIQPVMKHAKTLF